jgi:hypothetical protein
MSQDEANEYENDASPKIHLATFYTKGFQTDGVPGHDLRSCVKYISDVCRRNIDSFKAYSLDEVRDECPEAVQNFYYFFRPNEHSGFMGFFRWKAWILRKHLSFMRDGDILVYRDANFNKYPQYREGLGDIGSTAHWILSQLPYPLFIPIERPDCKIKHHVKRKAFIDLEMAPERIRELPLLYTCAMVMKKTDLVCQLVEDWWNACLLPGLVEPLHEGERARDFRHHTCANAVLNLVVRKYQLEGRLPMDLFQHYLENRTFTKDSVKLYYPGKEQPDGKSKMLNQIRHQELIPHYSDELVYWKAGDEWLLLLGKPSSFKWIGYEYNRIGKYRVSFDILFVDFVPTPTANVGFKTHEPQEAMHNNWLHGMEVGVWNHVGFVLTKMNTRSDKMILIFDGLVQPNRVRVRNFTIQHF